MTKLGLSPYIAHRGITIEKWRANLNENWIEWSHNTETGKCYSIFLFDKSGRQIARWTTLQKAETGIKNYLIDQTDPTG
jgi:abortive infection bacteriophage resistance protein